MIGVRRPAQVRRLRPGHRRGDARRRARRVVLPRPLPTPLLAFAIRHLGCIAGVMVTASHNPPQDNGYKVYLGDGSQIVPPADDEISARRSRPSARSPTSRAADGWQGPRRGDPRRVPRRGRRARRRRLAPRPDASSTRPLHGVGDETVETALQRAGFAAPTSCREQAEPDADFPTVAFPNPEEPGAMDLAMELAAEIERRHRRRQRPRRGSVRGRRTDGPHGWRMLRGDEVGALLADHLLRRGRRAVSSPPRSCPRRCSGEMAAAAAGRRTPRR